MPEDPDVTIKSAPASTAPEAAASIVGNLCIAAVLITLLFVLSSCLAKRDSERTEQVKAVAVFLAECIKEKPLEICEDAVDSIPTN